MDKFGTVAASSKSTTKTNTETARKSDNDDERADEFETPAQHRQRVKREKEERVKQVIRNAREAWDPTSSDPPPAVSSSFPTSRGDDGTNNADEDKMDVVGDDSRNDGGKTNNKDDAADEANNRDDNDKEGDNNEQNFNPNKKNQNSDTPSVEKTKEPYSTVFVWNLSLTTVELRLQDAFEQFGPVRAVAIPKDRDGVPRGYAFVEFEEERDANVAVRQGDGMRVDGRRIKVDVERGRTVKGWLPNRLDGPFNSCSPNRRRR